jgi:hypothetical protein
VRLQGKFVVSQLPNSCIELEQSPKKLFAALRRVKKARVGISLAYLLFRGWEVMEALKLITSAVFVALRQILCLVVIAGVDGRN